MDNAPSRMPAPRQPFGSFVRGRYVLIGLLLGAALGGTALLQYLHVDRAVATAESRQERAVAEGLAFAQRDLHRLETMLRGEAETLSDAVPVQQTLRAHPSSPADPAAEAAARHFATLSLPERVTADLFDRDGTALAWKGPRLEMTRDTLPRTSVTQLVQEGDIRKALVVWMPVREGPVTLGMVRLMRVLEARSPVQNQYLEDYRRAQVWRRSTGTPVELLIDAPVPDVAPADTVQLRGIDGRALGGTLVAERPNQQAVVESLDLRYRDVRSVWLTLLLAWGLWGLWMRYRRQPEGWRKAGYLVLVLGAWWAVRYALLALNVPGRWQRPRAPLAPLFDPAHFASTLGGGLLRSTGDFLLTVLFGLVTAFAVVHFIRRQMPQASAPTRSAMGGLVRGTAVAAGAAVLLMGAAATLAVLARRAVLDSTLDYLTGMVLLPDPLVVVVFCTLLLATLALLLLSVAVLLLAHRTLDRLLPSPARWYVAAAGMAPVVGSMLLWSDAALGLPWVVLPGFLLVAFAATYTTLDQRPSPLRLLSLRSIILSLFMLSLVLYPAFFNGMDEQRRFQMADAAASFDEGQDPRVVYGIERLLSDAQETRLFWEALTSRVASRDTVANTGRLLLRSSLLSSLNTYATSLTLHQADGTPVVRFSTAGPGMLTVDERPTAVPEFELMRQIHDDRPWGGVLVEQLTGRREPDRFQYAGLAPLQPPALIQIPAQLFPLPRHDLTAGWVLVRAEPQRALLDEGTPFPRVLLPAGSYGNLYRSLSMAEFREGMLTRSFGRNFGRYRLAADIQQQMSRTGRVWRAETIDGERFLTLYRQATAPRSAARDAPEALATSPSVIAVRITAIGMFDHLYYLLRLTVAGLFVAFPFYLLGLLLRWRAGLLPAPHVRFRDRVLNAFLVVGIVAVAAVGVIGQQMVITETDSAVRDWLRQHLERVEETLALSTTGEELPYQALEQTTVQELARQVGRDLNLYRDGLLVASSRPQLVRDRLIDDRLPAEVHQALEFDGFRFAFAEAQLGSFRYTSGYHALLDEQRRPRYVVGLPTLPEQERIEEERARTIAYLFGALLLLVLVVMLTAGALARALARPIARLRAGLEDVARGRFERTLPVDSRDEIGELVQTFNEMQAQLAESRRQLTQQERQLAWREMARQVAHEIKNPLTPMKLSVQHLQRAYKDATLHAAVDARSGTDAAKDEAVDTRFQRTFERITNTLIEQINALARIANEFSTFARMPTRHIERLDLNDVVREAGVLMQEEAGTDITFDLTDEPLIVEADREELRRSYINLIKNALQAVPEDRAPVIAVRTRPDTAKGRAWAYSAVEDNGGGVPPELQNKIFQPNFSTKTSGTGLGLAVVRKSIEDVGGTVGFETTQDEGTTFWIQLPQAEES